VKKCGKGGGIQKTNHILGEKKKGVEKEKDFSHAGTSRTHSYIEGGLPMIINTKRKKTKKGNTLEGVKWNKEIGSINGKDHYPGGLWDDRRNETLVAYKERGRRVTSDERGQGWLNSHRHDERTVTSCRG